MSVNLTNALQNIGGSNVYVAGPNASRQSGVFLEDSPTVIWNADSFGNIQATSGSSLIKKVSIPVSGVNATITFDNIPQNFTHLRVMIKGYSSTSDNGQLTVYINQDHNMVYTSNSIANFNQDAVTGNALGSQGHGIIGGVGIGDLWAITDILIFDYTNPTTQLTMTGFGGGGTYGASAFSVQYSGTTGSMLRLDLSCENGTFDAGSTAWLYGIS